MKVNKCVYISVCVDYAFNMLLFLMNNINMNIKIIT